MTAGTIILIPFPFAEQTATKVRPAVVIAVTKDKYEDIIVCAISSVVPDKLNDYEIKLEPDKINNLRVVSIIKVDRIATLKRENLIAVLGSMSNLELSSLKSLLHNLIY